MIDMGQIGGSLPPAVGFIGSATALFGGAFAYVTSPDPATGTAGLYVGVGGLLMGAATILGVLGDKWLPHFVQWARIRAENQEEYRKNREARHRLANELNTARLEMVVLRREAAEAKEKANQSENIAIEAATKLALVEKYTQERIRHVERGVRSNSERLEVVESKSDEVLPIPTEPPGTTP